MKLGDCEVGAEVVFRVGFELILGIVCHHKIDYTTIGYPTQPTHFMWWNKSSTEKALEHQGCLFGWTFESNINVDSCISRTMNIVSRKSDVQKSSGMRCSGPCKDFNQYAEPNQTDGTYKCYGCRSH